MYPAHEARRGGGGKFMKFSRLWVANSSLKRFLAVLPTDFPLEIDERDRLDAKDMTRSEAEVYCAKNLKRTRF